jgi:hypothetical protein
MVHEVMANGVRIGEIRADGTLALYRNIPVGLSGLATDNKGRILVVDARHGGPIDQRDRRPARI